MKLQTKGLNAMVMKYSRQRAAILNFLKSRKDHPTAELVYSNVKEEFPNISLGTVYRNLNQLADAGMVAKLSFGLAATDHFDYNTTPHQHFICNKCKAVIDLPMASDFSDIDKTASEGFDGQIEGHRLYFCGICKDCLKTK
jgi:Fur family peroxide stress response transcriptional regulator